MCARLLYLLELADVRGRVTADRADRLELVELFRLGAEEFGVWPHADPYANWRAAISRNLQAFSPAYRALVFGRGVLDFEAGLIQTPQEAVARAYAARAGFPQLVVTCGLSGAGKSSWVAERLPHHAVLQAATNTRHDFRAGLMQLGRDSGALTTLAVFQAPLGTLLSRNPTRSHPVSPQVVAAQVEHAEFPYLPEAHRLVLIDECGGQSEPSGPTPCSFTSEAL